MVTEDTSMDVEGNTTGQSISPEQLSERKLVLEVLKLERELARSAVLIRRVGVWAGVIATFVAVFSGIFEFSQAIAEARESRIGEEKAEISASLRRISSDEPRQVSDGAVGLIQFAEDPTHRAAILSGLKAKLATLQRPSDPGGTRSEQRRREMSLVQPLVPLIDEYPEDREGLYDLVARNEALSYGRIVGLKQLDDEQKWKRALASSDSDFVEGAVKALGESDADYAPDLLIPLLRSSKHQFIVPAAAARALGGLGADQAIGDLTGLLKSPVGDVRRAATQALGALGDERAIRPLREAASAEQDTEVRNEMNLTARDIQRRREPR